MIMMKFTLTYGNDEKQVSIEWDENDQSLQESRGLSMADQMVDFVRAAWNDETNDDNEIVLGEDGELYFTSGESVADSIGAFVELGDDS